MSVSKNSYGQYYLYGVKDDSMIEYSYFATADVHELIQKHALKTGSTFILKKSSVMNGGKKHVPKIEFAIVGEAEPEAQSPAPAATDNLKQVLLTCLQDAADVVKSVEIQFSNDELQKLATTLFIQRTKNAA